jgi:uncharacterized protein (TIGR00369 family)
MGEHMEREQNDERLFKVINDMFNEKIPFNKVLGLKVAAIGYQRVKVRFEMRDELIGNYIRGTLHGGVISSVVDVTGGLAAFMGIQEKIFDRDLDAKLERFGRLGTIDLRVDYLRPGIGESFVSTGYTLRTGNKVAVARIELINDRDDLIAVGTGSYVVA